MTANGEGYKKLWADHWATTLRGIYRWEQAHREGKMPHFSDVPAMLVWVLTARGLTEETKARAAAIRSGEYVIPEMPEPPPPPEPTAAWTKFKEARQKKGHAEQLGDLEAFRDFYASKLGEAIDLNQISEIKLYNELLLDTANSIRQQKLAADKLGIEEGRLYTKEQLRAIIRAWAFWAMRGVDTDLPDLCKNVVGVKSVDEARRITEPILLSARFLKPFAKAARVDGESELAPWIVAEMREAVDDYLENGAEKFQEEAKL